MDVSTLGSPAAMLSPPPRFSGAVGGDVIWNFDQGHPPWDSFPKEDLIRIAAEVVDARGPVVLDYFDQNFGYGEVYYGSVLLREQIVGYLKRVWNQEGSVDGVMVTNGSVQGIALTIAALVGPDDAVFMEAASFPYAVRFSLTAGGHVYPVTVQEDGMDLEDLERQVERARAAGHRPKLIYTIPTFQMPTGKVLSEEKRRRLLEIAADEDLVVLEDNIYGVFRYDGSPVRTLASLDTEGRVVQSDSFCKTTAPGVRLGWISGSPEMLEMISGVRQDFGPNQWLEAILTQYVQEGLLERHIAEVVPSYRAKRDAVEAALNEYCLPHLSFDTPPGSFYYWLRIGGEVDVDRLATATRSRGLLARPGEMFMGKTSGPSYMRLAFVHVSEGKIARGISELGKALAESAD